MMRPLVHAFWAALALLLAAGLLEPVCAGPAPEASAFFSPEQIARGKAYRFENRVAFFLSLGLKVGALALLLATGLGGTLRDAVSRLAGHRPWLSALLFSAALLSLLSIVSFPVSLYSGHYHEHVYGMSTQGLGGWLLDYGKSTLVSLAVFSPVGLALWGMMRRFPEGWWLPAWGAASVGSVLLVFVAPVVIDPIFHAFKPVADAAFRDRALGLARQAGVRVEEVLEMNASRRTRRVNAYFTGLGHTRRIVIYDTLLRGSTPDEAALILAHEIGHWRHEHIWKGIGLSCLGTLAILLAAHWAVRWAAATGRFGLGAPHDPQALALILGLIVVANFVSLPLQNAISRSFERQADAESLTLTDQPEVFVETERKLAVTNLADVTPGRWAYFMFYTHPSVLERIGMAIDYRKAAGGRQ